MKQPSLNYIMRFIDLTGKKFGKLFVLCRDDNAPSHWVCICECGTTKTVLGKSLKSGNTKSCGCAAHTFIDLHGQVFNRLTVIGRTKKYKQKSKWECLCSCGNIVIKACEDLVSGKSGSCGCYMIDVTRARSTKHGKATARDRAPEYKLWCGAKNRARKFGLSFDITVDDIVIPPTCPVFNIPFFSNVGGKTAIPNSPSVDRIIPELGYIKNNIWVISHRANTLKSNCSVLQIQALLDALKKEVVARNLDGALNAK